MLFNVVSTMDFQTLSYLVACFIFGLVVLFTEVRGENVLYKSNCNFSEIYNFGDSNSDTGTLSAVFIMVHPPNGESFPEILPTRSCDGRLLIDFIGKRKTKLYHINCLVDLPHKFMIVYCTMTKLCLSI